MQSIIFKQFYQDSQQYELLLNEILNSTFDSEKGDGFHIIEATSEYIKSLLTQWTADIFSRKQP